MIPIALIGFIRKVPREVWYALAIGVFFLILRQHWIHVGVTRCESAHKAAEAQALAEAVKQENEAPAVAQKAIEAVKPQIIERTRIIRENIPASISCPDYNDSVQQAIREAAAATD